MPEASRNYRGPAILSGGFRPFFLLGSVYAGLIMVQWLGAISGHGWIASAFAPLDWHIHEMLFGVFSAIVAGFLLTAIPNWTGRLPIRGTPLLVLVIAWLAGRVAVQFSQALPAWLTLIADLAFQVLLMAATMREIVAGKNWRNLRVMVPIGLLLLANALFHVEATVSGEPVYARRLGVAALLGLLMLIGGRIVPSFTRNWLVRENPGRLPTPFDRFDALAMALSILALLAWIVAPGHAATGILLIAGGVFQLIRLSRWAGDRTFADPLVLILHVAYLFVALGFVLTGAADFIAAIPTSAGLHAWTVGAMATMTLAVMSRASLGHSGRALRADPPLQAIYLAIVLAAIGRVAAALLPAHAMTLYQLSGYLWITAYLGFALVFAPILMLPRPVAARS